MSAGGKYSLEITAMKYEDVGIYRCFAENSEGSAFRTVRVELAGKAKANCVYNTMGDFKVGVVLGVGVKTKYQP